MGENAAIVISSDFKKVIMRSIYWSEKSNGAFDITSLPLTNIWREGKKDREYKEKWEPPSDLDIAIAKDKVGFKKIGRNLRPHKEKPNPSNDLSRSRKPIFGQSFE